MKRKTHFDTLEDASHFVGLLEIWKTIKNFDDFLRYSYSLGFEEERVIPGYKFFLDVWFRNFLKEIVTSTSIELEDNYEFHRVMHEGVQISKISDSCEKIILIRKYYKFMKSFEKTKKDEISKKLINFDDFVSKFEKDLWECIYPNKELKFNLKKRKKLSFLALFLFNFTQVNENIPPARDFSLFDFFVHPEKSREAFLGYKLVLSYVWMNKLTEKEFQHLKELKNSIDWSREYFAAKYIKENPKKFKKKSNLFPELSVKIPGKTLDCFFRDIHKKIVEPIETKDKIKIGWEVFFLFKKNISKINFSTFLKDNKHNLKGKEKIDELFLWYNAAEVIDSARKTIFNGASSFIMFLEGAVRWKERIGDDSPIQVLKIIHPLKNNESDFSYGVLIESRGTFFSDWSGWLIFYDVCGNYSGFSGQDHAYIERIIKIHKDSGSVLLRTQNIKQKDFAKYLSKKATERNIGPTNNKYNKTLGALNEARGMLLELLGYYLEKQIKGKIIWSWEDKDSGDVDIVVEEKSVVRFIECKINPNVLYINEEVKKLKNKLKSFETSKKKVYEFVFWIMPTSSVKRKLKENKVKYSVLETNLVNGIIPLKKYKKLKSIMNI